MAFRSDISVAITACLLGIAFASSTTHRETLSKLKALQSLVFNNAQATVTLDSTALKQLVKLASSGKSSAFVFLKSVYRHYTFHSMDKKKNIYLQFQPSYRFHHFLTFLNENLHTCQKNDFTVTRLCWSQNRLLWASVILTTEHSI